MTGAKGTRGVKGTTGDTTSHPLSAPQLFLPLHEPDRALFATSGPGAPENLCERQPSEPVGGGGGGAANAEFCRFGPETVFAKSAESCGILLFLG